MKSNPSRFLFTVAVLVASALVSSEPSKAVTYSYSSQLTNVSVDCSPQPCGGGGSTLTIQLVDDLPLGASGTFTELAIIADDVYAYTKDGPHPFLYQDYTAGTVTLSNGSIIDWSFSATNGNSHFHYSASSISGDDSGSVDIFYVDNENCFCLVTSNVTASGGPGRWTPSITPLPAALPLFTTGLGALGLLSWRRKRKATLRLRLPEAGFLLSPTTQLTFLWEE